MSRLVRIAIVLALVALDLGFVLPDIIRLVHPIGDLGFQGTQGAILSVVPGGPAARAGIVPGDLVIVSSAQERIRMLYSGNAVLEPGARATVNIMHRDLRHRVTLVGVPYSEYPVWMVALRVLVETFWVALAAFLVLRRPRLQTWAFFLFSIFPGIAPTVLAGLTYPTALLWPNYLSWFVVAAVISTPAQIFFILSLGARPVPRWHWVAGYVLVPLFLILALPTPIASLLWILAGMLHSVLDPFYQFYFSSGIIAWLISIPTWSIPLALLGFICAENRGKERQRVVWVFVGFAIYTLAQIALFALPPTTSIAVYAPLYILEGALPLFVTYAILKHRLIDIGFFVSRTLIFTIISGSVIVIFGVIDWLFTKELNQRQLGTVTEVLGAIALGFWFSGIHRRVDHFVDSVFFRRKHLAEKRLRQLAKVLPHSSSWESISKSLMDEPLAALELASAALFQLDKDAGFHRVSSRGWADSDLSEVPTGDGLLLHLQQDGDVVVLHDLMLENHDFPRGPAKPDVALTISVRNELAAIAFYGAHSNGEHLDSDEIAALAGLGLSASVGYEHAELLAFRREAQAERQEAELAKQEGRRHQGGGRLQHRL